MNCITWWPWWSTWWSSLICQWCCGMCTASGPTHKLSYCNRGIKLIKQCQSFKCFSFELFKWNLQLMQILFQLYSKDYRSHHKCKTNLVSKLYYPVNDLNFRLKKACFPGKCSRDLFFLLMKQTFFMLFHLSKTSNWATKAPSHMHIFHIISHKI